MRVTVGSSPTPGAVMIGEPYRLFFPLGLLFLVLGAGVWLVPGWPTRAHPALMASGLTGCFAVGFLMTMLPNLLQTGLRLRLPLAVAASGALFGLVGLLAGWQDALWPMNLAWFLAVATFAVIQAPHARRLPPPRMAVGGAAIVSGLISALLGCADLLGAPLPLWLLLGAHDLLVRGVILLLVVAIGGFLLPRLAEMDVPDPARMAGSQAARWRYACFALLGLALAASFPAERWLLLTGVDLADWPHRLLLALRAGLFLVLLSPALALITARVPLWLRCAALACWLVALGSAAEAAWPGLAIAWKHVVFVGGLLQLTLLIAARVVTAHAGRPGLMHEARWSLLGIVLLVQSAMLSRIGAQWAPTSYLLHLQLASIFALAAVSWWALRFAPLLWVIRPAGPPSDSPAGLSRSGA